MTEIGPETEMAGPERRPPFDLEGVPEEEQVSEADAAERVDEDPEDQRNREDPVWSERDDDSDDDAKGSR